MFDEIQRRLYTVSPEERIVLRRYIYVGDIGHVTYREWWRSFVRPPIDLLMRESANNSVAVIMLLLPWMDRLFTIAKFGYDDAVHSPKRLKFKYNASDIMAHYFTWAKGCELEALAEFYVAMKHDGFPRANATLFGFPSNHRIEHVALPVPYIYDQGVLDVQPDDFCCYIIQVIEKIFSNAEILDDDR